MWTDVAILALGVFALVACVYAVRRHQIEDLRTWLVVEGLPVTLVAVILLTLVWLLLTRL